MVADNRQAINSKIEEEYIRQNQDARSSLPLRYQSLIQTRD
ncbi:hypothetical protein [Nostoc sp. JL33]|nr:hypothetical protein [Nostoc sp. JL33]